MYTLRIVICNFIFFGIGLNSFASHKLNFTYNNVLKIDGRYDPKDLDPWVIDPAIALAMIINNGRSGKPSTIINYKDGIMKLARDRHPQATKIGFISARYREEDEERYKEKRNIENSSPAWRVKEHYTRILEVQVRKRKDNGIFETEKYYYDVATICPPPYNTPCPSEVPPPVEQ